MSEFAKIKEKLSVLAEAAKYDASCASSGSHRKRALGGLGNAEGLGICHSYTPDGRCVSLLKLLLTNHCVFDCKFCVNRVSSPTKRARFTPEEVVWLTLEFYRRNYIEGLFLSSGIVESADVTMEQLVRVASLLRRKHRFNGYIHLKVVPGASAELIEQAGLWADRVSANIELPTQDDLDLLAPAKKIATAQGSMAQIRDRRIEAVEETKKSIKAPRFAPAGQTTQMIVGATASPDAVLLQTSQTLYNDFKLRRVYYSAYSPIPNADAVLPSAKPVLVRENRLYQADWLLRFYGFKANELTSAAEPNLPLDVDPKMAWALRHRAVFPVDINVAPREELWRIPGIGVRNVERILQMRVFRRLTLADLAKLRVPLKKARYFVVTADHNPDLQLLDRESLVNRVRPPAQQLSLFDDQLSRASGEL